MYNLTLTIKVSVKLSLSEIKLLKVYRNKECQLYVRLDEFSFNNIKSHKIKTPLKRQTKACCIMKWGFQF